MKWNHPASYARLPTALEDIRLLFDQRSEAQFEWTPYEDLAIRTVILDEYLQNPNGWHVKVPLVNFATVEMHQSDRVLRERRGPLNPRRRDDGTGPSTRPKNSPGPSSTPITLSGPTTAPIQSLDPVVQPTIPTAQPFQMMSGDSSSQHRQSDPLPDESESPLKQPQPPSKAR
ncbi:hypothetical protein Gotur_010590 [Gossypium turneri]